MKNITLVIPAKNEKESLPDVLDELKKFNVNKIVVLESSDTDTIDAIKNYDCDILFQSINGYGAALIEGIKNVKTKYFCIYNADGSFYPNELSSMLNELDKNNVDIVFGSRYEINASSEDDTIITLIGNFIFTKIGRIFFKLNITDILYTYVMGYTQKVKNLNLNETTFNFCVELPIKAKRYNLNIKSIPSFERKRIAGVKKVNAFKDGFSILLYMVKLFFVK